MSAPAKWKVTSTLSLWQPSSEGGYGVCNLVLNASDVQYGENDGVHLGGRDSGREQPTVNPTLLPSARRQAKVKRTLRTLTADRPLSSSPLQEKPPSTNTKQSLPKDTVFVIWGGIHFLFQTNSSLNWRKRKKNKKIKRAAHFSISQTQDRRVPLRECQAIIERGGGGKKRLLLLKWKAR